MTGTTRSSDGLDPRRRKILFRAWHRGMRELDLLLGRFADAYIADLSDDDLGAFERLMEVPDGDLLAWITGREAIIAQHATPLYSAIIRFHAPGHEQD